MIISPLKYKNYIIKKIINLQIFRLFFKELIYNIDNTLLLGENNKKHMETTNLLSFIEKRTKELEDHIALGIRSNLGWNEMTFKGLSILSRKLASYMIDIGLKKGDKVAILSESMPELGATLFANVLSGVVSVPLDIKLTIHELNHILSDCMPRAILVSSSHLSDAVKLKEMISYDKNSFIYTDNPLEILAKFKPWVEDYPLLLTENTYTLDYLKNLDNKKELIYPYLNMTHSYNVFNEIIDKYKLKPSNHLVDLLYEAVIYESNK